MYPTFYVDMIPIGLAVYVLFKIQSAKVIDITLRLAQFSAILLLLAQLTWIKSYLNGFYNLNLFADFIWTIFNAVVMVVMILVATRRNEDSDPLSDKIKFIMQTTQDKTESVFLLGLVAIVLGVGFIVGVGDNDNYAYLYQLYNGQVWGALFITYGVFRFASLIFNTPCGFKLFLGIVGMWAWNYVALSFTVFDQSPVAPTEYLLFVPVLVEAWVLLSTVKSKWSNTK